MQNLLITLYSPPKLRWPQVRLHGNHGNSPKPPTDWPRAPSSLAPSGFHCEMCPWWGFSLSLSLSPHSIRSADFSSPHLPGVRDAGWKRQAVEGASVVVAPRLWWRTGLVALWHVGSPRSRVEPVSPASAGGFFTTEPPGRPPGLSLEFYKPLMVSVGPSSLRLITPSLPKHPGALFPRLVSPTSPASPLEPGDVTPSKLHPQDSGFLETLGCLHASVSRDSLLDGEISCSP